ncbi:MAG: ATP-binding protein [Thermoleophilia bacterium]
MIRALLGGAVERPERAVAIFRLAVLPVILAGERLVEHHHAQRELFLPLLGVAVVWAVANLWSTTLGPADLLPRRLVASVDLALIVALTWSSGGPFSQVRYAFFVLPLGAALLLGPWRTVAVSAASIVAYVAIAALHPATDERADAVDTEVAQVLYLVWTGAVAAALSSLLGRRRRQVEALAATRGRLVAQALDAEDRERRRLAEALHDEAIQNLLAVRPELAVVNGSGPDLDLVRLGLDRTVEQLRGAIFDLHPYVLEHGGLAAALRAVAERHARHGGFSWRVDVDPGAAGVADQLLFSIARELIVNAARHAGASTVSIAVGRSGDAVVLEVADDGRGIDPAAVALAPAGGHVGLASCRERAEALDGTLEWHPRAGGGTVVRVAVPATRRTDDVRFG